VLDAGCSSTGSCPTTSQQAYSCGGAKSISRALVPVRQKNPFVPISWLQRLKYAELPAWLCCAGQAVLENYDLEDLQLEKLYAGLNCVE